MKDSKKVSIIVPIYNVEKYIVRCIESLINQTYENIEIILINDGATDSSYEHIRRYESDSRILIINKRNEGLASARNAGMDVMSGDYVLFVDGDDYIDLDAVRKMVEYASDGTKLIMFPYIREYGEDKFKMNLFEETYIEFDKHAVENRIFAKLVGPDPEFRSDPTNMDRLNTAWGKLYDIDLVKNIRFTNTQEIGPEDCWFNIQVLRACESAKYVDNIYYHYEKTNQNSLLHTYNERFFEKRRKMYSLVEDFIRNNELGQYQINLKNRMICEEYSLLQNIWFSNMDKMTKRKFSREIINDKSFKELYSQTDLKFISWKWRVFYYLCKVHCCFAIELLFTGYLKIKKLDERTE